MVVVGGVESDQGKKVMETFNLEKVSGVMHKACKTRLTGCKYGLSI